MKTRNVKTGCLLCTALLLGGCDEFAKALEQSADVAAQAAAEQAEANAQGGQNQEMDEDDLLGQKLNAYVDCINSFSKSVLDNRARYFQWCNPETGPTGKEKIVYGLYSMNDPKKCIDGLEAAAGQQPADAELEEAGKSFGDALSNAFPVVNEAHKYYDEKNYKDDKFEKGRELHPKLVAAFGEFDAANGKMREIFKQRQDALQLRTLEKIEKREGKSIYWHRQNVMLKAKVLIEVGDVKSWEEVDLAKFEPALTEYTQAVDDMDQHAKGAKEETDKMFSFSSFQSATQDYKKAAKELMRRKRDNKKYSRGEKMNVGGSGEWMVDGSPGKFFKAYNGLVDSSNRL